MDGTSLSRPGHPESSPFLSDLNPSSSFAHPFDSPSSPSTSNSTAMGCIRRWARRIERSCCTCAKYFPLVFVYGLTSWAAYVLVVLCSTPSKVSWLGAPAGTFGVALYLLLNWSYTTAVFTPPGSTTNDHGYSTLPMHATPAGTSFTAKSNGELRFCKKCQARKPDRAHHCSTCRRCVLKMDHHCPWLATCVGLRNHKAFLLFLIYTSLFCIYCFAASGAWVWVEIFETNTGPTESLMPVNYIMLSIISGIIGIVINVFCGWHIYLTSKGQTTIECLEKTRYLSPLRRSMHQTYINQHTPGQGVNLPSYGQQLLDLHQNAIPGVTRPEEGEELRPEPSHTPRNRDFRESELGPGGSSVGPALQAGSRRFTPSEMERNRARQRYEEYLDEQDSTRLPNAFDLGARRNLLHLFGPNAWLWPIPVCTTTGDGWSWEPNPRWVEAREKLARDRAAQAERERAAGWGGGGDDEDEDDDVPDSQALLGGGGSSVRGGAGRHYLQPQPPRPVPLNRTSSPLGSSGLAGSGTGRRTPSKADRILGRDPNMYSDDRPGGGGAGESVSLRRLNPATGKTIDEELEEIDREEEEEEEEQADLISTVPKPQPPLQPQQRQQLPQTQSQQQKPNPPQTTTQSQPSQPSQQQRQPPFNRATNLNLNVASNPRWGRSPSPGSAASTLLRGPVSPALSSHSAGLRSPVVGTVREKSPVKGGGKGARGSGGDSEDEDEDEDDEGDEDEESEDEDGVD